MVSSNPHSTAQIAGHPIHPMLIPFPVAFLVATLVCDLIFWKTGSSAWSTASLYLLGAALIMAALAALAGLTDFLNDTRIRDLSAALASHDRQRCRSPAFLVELVSPLRTRRCRCAFHAHSETTN
jgi:uncharacterized membrane protein